MEDKRCSGKQYKFLILVSCAAFFRMQIADALLRRVAADAPRRMEPGGMLLMVIPASLRRMIKLI